MQQFRKQLPFTTREEWKNMVDISIIVFPVINSRTPLPIQQQVYLFCRSLVNVVIYAGLCCGIILNNEMSYPLDVVIPPRLITRII